MRIAGCVLGAMVLVASAVPVPGSGATQQCRVPCLLHRKWDAVHALRVRGGADVEWDEGAARVAAREEPRHESAPHDAQMRDSPAAKELEAEEPPGGAGLQGAEQAEDESADAGDRAELCEPYYNGVRVKCLFACEDTGAEQWCAGTIQYTRRSTKELRVAFDEVPSWESAKRIYWPVDDADIKVLPGQEGGPLLGALEREALSKQMMEMVEVLDWPRVRRALWLGADPLFTQHMGQTVLHAAALAGDLDTVKAAIRRAADKAAFLNLATAEGNTPLHYAAADPDCGVLRQLLRAGANLAAKNAYGQMPLHFAEAAGNAKGYKLLHDSMAQRLAELRRRASGAAAGVPGGGGVGGGGGGVVGGSRGSAAQSVS